MTTKKRPLEELLAEYRAHMQHHRELMDDSFDLQRKARAYETMARGVLALVELEYPDHKVDQNGEILIRPVDPPFKVVMVGDRKANYGKWKGVVVEALKVKGAATLEQLRTNAIEMELAPDLSPLNLREKIRYALRDMLNVEKPVIRYRADGKYELIK